MSSLLEQLQREIAESGSKSESLDYSKGVFKIIDYKQQLINQFKNGKKRGETTHIPELDPYYTWKKGFVQCITGNPNAGKSEWVLQLMAIKAVFSGWKFLIFPPENMSTIDGSLSPDEITDTLIHSLTGQSTDPYYKQNQMPLSLYEKMIDFVDKHFRVVYPPEYKVTPERLIKYLDYECENFKPNGILIDPFNKLTHEYNGLLDSYLAETFSLLKRFTIKNDLVTTIVEHPTRRMKENGVLPMADQYSLRGGAMWNNAMDIIGTVHRPNADENIQDTAVEFHTLKIRNQKLVGVPGVLRMDFDRKQNRYLINGRSPLDKFRIDDSEQKNVFEKHTLETFENGEYEEAPF